MWNLFKRQSPSKEQLVAHVASFAAARDEKVQEVVRWMCQYPDCITGTDLLIELLELHGEYVKEVYTFRL